MKPWVSPASPLPVHRFGGPPEAKMHRPADRPRMQSGSAFLWLLFHLWPAMTDRLLEAAGLLPALALVQPLQAMHSNFPSAKWICHAGQLHEAAVLLPALVWVQRLQAMQPNVPAASCICRASMDPITNHKELQQHLYCQELPAQKILESISLKLSSRSAIPVCKAPKNGHSLQHTDM